MLMRPLVAASSFLPMHDRLDGRIAERMHVGRLEHLLGLRQRPGSLSALSARPRKPQLHDRPPIHGGSSVRHLLPLLGERTNPSCTWLLAHRIGSETIVR